MVEGRSGSGLSIQAYCAKHGVRTSAYYWWRAELARRDAASPPATFVPVRVIAEPSRAEDGYLEIVLPGGRQVRVQGRVDRQALADVLAVLGAPPC
jgi:hypothetical protein